MKFHAFLYEPFRIPIFPIYFQTNRNKCPDYVYPLQIDNKKMARLRVQTVDENAQIKTTTNQKREGKRTDVKNENVQGVWCIETLMC